MKIIKPRTPPLSETLADIRDRSDKRTAILNDCEYLDKYTSEKLHDLSRTDDIPWLLRYIDYTKTHLRDI